MESTVKAIRVADYKGKVLLCGVNYNLNAKADEPKNAPIFSIHAKFLKVWEIP